MFKKIKEKVLGLFRKNEILELQNQYKRDIANNITRLLENVNITDEFIDNEKYNKETAFSKIKKMNDVSKKYSCFSRSEINNNECKNINLKEKDSGYYLTYEEFEKLIKCSNEEQIEMLKEILKK